MFQYITVEEVLTPAVTKLGQDKNVRLYFENVQKKPIWADEEMFFFRAKVLGSLPMRNMQRLSPQWLKPGKDFELFFGTRANEWDYDAKRAEVRLRSKHEQMAQLLRRARSVAEVGAAISASYEETAWA
eukprot:s88_g11.t1